MVGLSGVVVNDSIVLISFANSAKQRGLSVRDAILDAASKRLRPIVLTTVTTVGGVLPIALGLTGKSAVWSPLATLIVRPDDGHHNHAYRDTMSILGNRRSAPLYTRDAGMEALRKPAATEGLT